MMKISLFLAFLGGANAAAVDLSPSNFDDIVMNSGKNALVKFLAPWWGHCKKMKPDWDKLGSEFKDSSTVVIADVDCTVHQSLCSEHGVRGYPTIKAFYDGEPEDYKGGRSFKDLKGFVDKNMMEPACDSNNEDKCTAEQLELLAKSKAMTADERTAGIEAKTAEMKAAEKSHEDLLESLQSQYKASMEKTEETVAALKKEIKWLKAVKAPKGKDEL